MQGERSTVEKSACSEAVILTVCLARRERRGHYGIQLHLENT